LQTQRRKSKAFVSARKHRADSFQFLP
jgi:hypothetical protein